MELTKLLSLALTLTPASAALFCKTQSQPNPIAKDFPKEATGTINGTVAILPIPYALARQIVPAEYNILQNTYQSMLPDFPKDMYPAMLQSQLDHDVQASGIKLSDFSRSSVSFPFVDRLGDGYTSMTYGHNIMLSALNVVAILGTVAYGFSVTGGSFTPKCDAYECANEDCSMNYFAAYDVLKPFSGPVLSQNFTISSEDKSPFSLDFYKNVTNQPQFSNNKDVCDKYVRLFNASVTQGEYAPRFVKGTVSVTKPLLPEAKTWSEVWGLQMDNAFIEHNYVSCKGLQGYVFDG